MSKELNNFPEKWLVTNNESKIIVINVANSNIPGIKPGKSINILKFASKEDISQSSGFRSLLKSGKLTLTKIEGENSRDEIISVEKDEIPDGDSSGGIEIEGIQDNEVIRWALTDPSSGEGEWENGTAANADLDGYLNGMSIERQSIFVVIEDSKVYLDVEAIGGGDIEYYLDDTLYTLDCTTGDGVAGKARVELTQGTAIKPQGNIVYVEFSEQHDHVHLAVATLQYPIESYALVALLSIQDYVTVGTNGPLSYQRATEAIAHNGRGAIAWEREKIRALGAQYWTGVDQSLDISTVGTEDNVNFTTTSGKVFQLHRQDWPNYDVSTDGIMVTNVRGNGVLTNYQKITDLNAIHEIASGTEISTGDSINLVIWGSINYSGTDCKLFVNLPSDKYTIDEDAVIDKDNTAVTVIPEPFKTTGFLIAKLVLKYENDDGGTWTNLLQGVVETWHTAEQTFSTPLYPDNYPNNYNAYIATVTEPGAEAMRIVFDEFNTESNYDYIYLDNAAETNIHTYHGNLGPFTSAEVIGDTIKIFFHSDGSVQRSGVLSTRYEYLTTAASGQQVVDLRGIPTGFNLGAGGGSGTTGVTDTFTNVSNFDISILNGVITSFTKNS